MARRLPLLLVLAACLGLRSAPVFAQQTATAHTTLAAEFVAADAAQSRANQTKVRPAVDFGPARSTLM